MRCARPQCDTCNVMRVKERAAWRGWFCPPQAASLEIGRSRPDTELMIRSRWFVRACLGLLCITIFLMRVGGAHLHLCFDGGEPPVSVHLSADTGADQPHAGVGQGHHDQDVSLSGEALAKKLDGALQLPILLVVAFVLFLLCRPVGGIVVPRDRTAQFHPLPVFRIRPPLRAPPL